MLNVTQEALHDLASSNLPIIICAYPKSVILRPSDSVLFLNADFPAEMFFLFFCYRPLADLPGKPLETFDLSKMPFHCVPIINIRYMSVLARVMF